MKLQVKEHTRQPRSVLSRSPSASGIRNSFPFLVTACPRFHWDILERASCIAFGLIFGFQVSYSTPVTGTVLRQRRLATDAGPSSNSACITSAPPSSLARRRLPMQEPERVAEEAMASTEAERPREVRRACTVLDLAFPDALDNGTHFIRPVCGGTNGDPIRTGEHDAVAFASTRSSCVLRAHPRPCLPHLRLQSLCCPCPSCLHPSHPSPAHRAHRRRRPGAFRPPTAPDAAALTANPRMAPRSVAYSPRCCLRFCRSRPGTRCARSALHER